MRINKHLNNNNKQDEDLTKKKLIFDRSAIHKFPFPFWPKRKLIFVQKTPLNLNFSRKQNKK